MLEGILTALGVLQNNPDAKGLNKVLGLESVPTFDKVLSGSRESEKQFNAVFDKDIIPGIGISTNDVFKAGIGFNAGALFGSPSIGAAFGDSSPTVSQMLSGEAFRDPTKEAFLAQKRADSFWNMLLGEQQAQSQSSFAPNPHAVEGTGQESPYGYSPSQRQQIQPTPTQELPMETIQSSQPLQSIGTMPQYQRISSPRYLRIGEGLSKFNIV